MASLKMLAPWLPWIVLLVIGSLTGPLGFPIAVVAALVTALILAATRLDRGILMWVTLAFFAAVTVATLGFHNESVDRNFSTLANATLAVAAWGSLLVGKPFTLAAARQQTDPEHWGTPLFMRVNALISAAWATAFTVNAATSWAVARYPLPDWVGYGIPTATIVAAIVFSSWYPDRIRRRARAEAAGDTD